MPSKNKKENENRFICPFPDCGKTYWKEEGKGDMCPGHRQLVRDMAFALNNYIKMGPPKAKKVGGTDLVVPKPGEADKMIAELTFDAVKGGKK